jgi:membrane protein implicated in regulation of membrane protease activity
MEILIGIIASTIGALILILLCVIAFFGKRWMDEREQNEKDRVANDALEKEKRDNKEAEIRAELVTTTARIASGLAIRHDTSVAELKEEIAGNRSVYIKHYEGTSEQIKEMDGRLVKRMDIANGRTTKVEKAVKGIVKKCEVRSRVFYQAGVTERRKEGKNTNTKTKTKKLDGI